NTVSPFIFYQYFVPNGTLLRINYATAIKPEGLSYQTTFYKIRGIRLFMRSLWREAAFRDPTL
ncbi:MAG: hypothetical protein AABZ13_06000, partial [Planctomycetota bacterium]